MFAKMPVGTNFENSALKASFSLSSLQPSTGLESPEHAKIKNERLYNSLTKKRKDPKQDNWRKSWGSTYEHKDDFWSALQANYDYIMDNNLIDSCQEIDRDIQNKAVEEVWNINQLVAQFSELCAFLNDVQDAVYSKTENVTNWALRASHMEEMSRVSSRRKVFNEQANRLMDETSSLQDEVSWRVTHLNSKWEQIENSLSTNGCSRCEKETCPDVEHEVKCLRKWIKEMETRLQPLNFHTEWTLPELEKKALEHMVLQRDIENHSKIVSSVVRLCNNASTGPRDAKCHASNARRVANGLERRYHLLFLRSLEWQCHIESLFKLHNNRDVSSDADSDEEPCMKQPRLSSDHGNTYGSQYYNQDDMDPMSLTETVIMDIGSDPVSIVKMVENTNERNTITTNDIELCRSAEDQMKNQKNELAFNTLPRSDNEPCPENTFRISYSENTKNGYSLHVDDKSKEKNTLQKLQVSVDSCIIPNPTVANVGSYYYKHRDTDSELDTKDSIISGLSIDQKSKDDSSEDEFTYSAGPAAQLDLQKSLAAVDKPDSDMVLLNANQESIQLLVQRVEELVSTPNIDPLMFHTEQQKSKLSRVKEWLHFETEKPIDSCDASGECTSGDSEEDKESQSSEDLNDSIVTCRPMDDSQSNLNNSDTLGSSSVTSPESVKINLRPKRLHKGNRPWSVSCLSQLSHSSPTKSPSDPLPNFSISESALNQLEIPSPTTDKIRPFAASANSIGVQGNNSTSSTVEESGVLFLNEGTKCISVRKKKMRFRRKYIGKKNESGSESQSYKSPGQTNLVSPSKQLCTLVKSGSFSGSGFKMVAHERSTASDPSTNHNRSKGLCDTSTTSGADSDDDKKLQRLPKFLLGPHTGVVKGYCPPNAKLECRDSSPEKSNLNITEEQSSSLSEQAWDNYQEKYLSENYSEAHDSDAARRLLEFGEDYRYYLDSQSDCWSAHSQNHEYSPQFRRKPPSVPAYPDSDSEIEDIKQHINESKAQLKYTNDIYEKHVAMSLTEFLISSDCGEIITTCERHIYGLEVIIDANDDTKVLPDIEVLEVKALMSAWMDLKWSAKKMQSSRALYNEVICFKNDLLQYAHSTNPIRVEVKSKEELMAEIDRLMEVQHLLQDKKRRLLELNVAVHRYIVNEDTPCYTNLKSEVSDLYTLWNDTCQSIAEHLSDLSSHLQMWAQLESRLDELQSDLRSDGQTLRLLDTALNGGVVSMEVASSVRDVAKVLSESTNATQKTMLTADNENRILFNRTLSLSLLTEGSFSDSGISDEGSEQELSEREHRLSAIRRLVRLLEAIMAPESDARIKMTQRLEEAENELRKLQSQCRGLIVRTAVCAEVQTRGGQIANVPKSGKRKLSSEPAALKSKSGDPDDEPETSGSWFWRVIRVSIPFQVALVLIICTACLLEPSCCDSINNLNLSLTPQLRYIRGPPPV